MSWIGYFAMIEKVDKFIFLDDVQFSKRSWQQRNRIKTAQGELMVSLSVTSSGKKEQKIIDVELSPEHYSASKLLATVEQSYSKSPYFNELMPAFRNIVNSNTQYLCELNIELITWLNTVFEIKTPIERSSTLKGEGAKADRLADLCQKMGATKYLSAPGSRDYLEESNVFKDCGIEVIYHEYQHPVYKQLWGEFLPYMAAIDLAFNEGPASLSIIKSGVQA